MENKLCIKCGIEKSSSGFRIYSNGSISNTCKTCCNEIDKIRKKNLRKKRLETAIYKCSLCNVDKVLKDFSSGSKEKKNYKKKVCLECYRRISEPSDSLKKDSCPKLLKCSNDSKSNINYRIKKSLAAQLRTVLHKENTTMSYIGCPIQYLREWFEYNFNPEMNWDNYGKYWHIDHIIPVDSFDLTNETQKKICWNWTNLVPFVKKANSSKKSNIQIEQLETIRNKLIKFKEEGSTTKWFSDDYIVLLLSNEDILKKYSVNKKEKTI
jgi:hypothetical protein